MAVDPSYSPWATRDVQTTLSVGEKASGLDGKGKGEVDKENVF